MAGAGRKILQRRNHRRQGSDGCVTSQTGMSALPPKADMCSAQAHVCYGPKLGVPTCQSQIDQEPRDYAVDIAWHRSRWSHHGAMERTSTLSRYWHQA